MEDAPLDRIVGTFAVSLLVSVVSLAFVPVARGADDPVAFGKARLEAALPGAGARVEVSVTGQGEREGFKLSTKGKGARVEAADATGAMYGLLELAERARRDGEAALRPADYSATPFLRDRGLNLFLTLPWNYEKNDSDYDPAALTDPQRWWFANEQYWTTLLDEMAESRLDWLDLHGTWDVSVTDAPNLYAYFVQSDAYPEVGVAPDVKAKDLAQLNHVIELAHARGVRVSLMAYEARLTTPHRRQVPYPNDEATCYAYTRECVEKMIRGAPGLDAIGFRIGESGHGGDFFRCYSEAIAASGRDIPLVTRSWITRKEKVVPLARASSDFTVEIKYNGEQWGAPWMFAGGRAPSWYSYSFEDYLSDSGDAPAAKKKWPGNALAANETGTAAASHWPDEPYKIVWQVRANGTHRIFPFFAPDWVRRSIEPMRMGTASGFTIEPIDAYYPKSPKYYAADAANVSCDWIHQRDELYLMQWGRLGYDPKTSDDVFAQAMKERFGAAAPSLQRAWSAASRIVPIALMAKAIGPDHRDHAPELEWGGNTREFIEGEGLDTHVFRPIREEIALRATGGHDGRVSVLEVAAELESLAAKIDKELPALGKVEVPAEAAERGLELLHALPQMASLGRYYAGRFRSAWWAALAEAEPSHAGARRAAADAMESARAAWQQLSESPAAHYYKPFTERLRMHTNTFHWRDQLPAVTAEADSLKAAAESEKGPAATAPELAAPAELPKLSWKDDHGTIVASVPAKGLTKAWLLAKPLPSAAFFHSVAMEKKGETFVASFPRESFGHLVAAEIETKGGLRRIPDWRDGAPWLVVPSQAPTASGGATPLIYSSEEALAHLDPAALSPEKHGLLVVAPRAANFFRSFDAAAQRKVLDAVNRGMTLLVLQQDYTSGRYPLSWLPQPPRVENHRADVADPDGALGLEMIHGQDVVWQRFVATPDWKVEGDGTVAHQKLGRGEIWMVNARLIQDHHLPGCARALLKLLKSGGVAKPVVLIDPGSEGGHYATSVLPDFMNAHDVPFLVLGELVAREQGGKSAAVVPGRPWDDFVLGGRGPQLVKAFGEAQAKQLAAKPLAKSRDEFEAHRAAARTQVLQSLGLDPMPERTPLNAKVVGTLERDGYRIEKVVYESRPGFPVTAHLYVPTGTSLKGTKEGAKLPVIVNPHGHWEHKKSEPVVQQRMIQQALHGYLALIVDSPGFSFENDALIERRDAGSHFDWRYVLASDNATGFYVWDLMRGLDWLATRPEADLAHVGITGASGGGLATLWAFAADERFGAAVPVCFPTSLEIQPDNGCQCNHVPGTLRVGDRADALAVRAPAPILLIGADNDREFPPEGTKKTGEKLAALWDLFGAKEKTGFKIFHSGHDYNLEMVAAALGFFDRELRGVGDGSPLKLTARPTEPQDSKEMLCLPDPPHGSKSMLELATARLAAANNKGDAASFVELNGGVPAASAAPLVARDASGGEVALPKSPAEVGKVGPARAWVTFESAKGLPIPGVLWLPAKAPRGGIVLVVEEGKAAAERRLQVAKLVDGGFACLAIDPRGFGELAQLDLRLQIYMNQSPAFAAALDVARAVDLLAPIAGRVGVVGDGPAASLAALDAALIQPKLAFAVGRDGMHEFADAFDESVSLAALQPMADHAPKLSALRAGLKLPAEWTFRGDPEKDLFATVLRMLEKQ
jgi:cephalosporin-C deacetylase-like acetyl esterase